MNSLHLFVNPATNSTPGLDNQIESIKKEKNLNKKQFVINCCLCGDATRQ